MSDSNNQCPICGEGNLQPRVGKNLVEYKGQSEELELQFSLCDACGSEQSDSAQLRTNKRAMVAFKKAVDGLLSGTEVRAIREELGLSQAEAAQIFGGGPVAFSKYESDDVSQSEAMDKLLRLAAELPVAFDLLANQAGIDRLLVCEHWQDAKDWQTDPSYPAKGRRSILRVVSSSKPSTEQQARYAA